MPNGAIQFVEQSSERFHIPFESDNQFELNHSNNPLQLSVLFRRLDFDEDSLHNPMEEFELDYAQ